MAGSNMVTCPRKGNDKEEYGCSYIPEPFGTDKLTKANLSGPKVSRGFLIQMLIKSLYTLCLIKTGWIFFHLKGKKKLDPVSDIILVRLGSKGPCPQF